MYCFRCGRKLPGREINCPDCDTPQKRRQRRHRRMILGLFIFLSGAFFGSLFDTYIFKGEAWKHSLFQNLIKGSDNTELASDSIELPNKTDVKVEMRYEEKSEDKSISSNKEALIDKSDAIENNIKSEINDKKDEVKEALNKNVSVLDQEVKDVISQKNEIVIPVASSSLVGNNNMPSEIANLLSNSPVPEEIENEKNELLSKTDDEVIIVEELDTNEKVGSNNKVDESSAFIEAAPIADKDNLVEENSHFVYKGVKLLESNGFDNYHGFVSKNGKEIVFASNKINIAGKPTYQCFIKGKDEKSVAKRAFEWKGNVWTPELTPDGNMIVFSSDSAKPEHIFLFDRKSNNSMALTSGNSKNMMPSISPDGKKIAFVSNRGDGKNRIYVLDLFKKDQIKQITKGIVNDREPRWSPDGKSIIFTRIVENMKISHIMKVDVEPLGEPVVIVSEKSRNWMGALSPDSKMLAFTRSLNAGGSKNVIVLKELESGKEEVLNFPGIYESFRPVWSSDFSGFVFHVARKTGKDLFFAEFKKE